MLAINPAQRAAARTLFSIRRSSTFTPKDPDYELKVRESFAKQTAMTTLGASIASVAPGRVDLSLPFAPHIAQQHGFVHGGVIAAVLDSAAGYAAATLLPAEAGILSVEFKVNFLAPATGSKFIFHGRVKKGGRQLSFTEAEAVAVSEDGKKRVIATMQATMMAIYGRDGIKG